MVILINYCRLLHACSAAIWVNRTLATPDNQVWFNQEWQSFYFTLAKVISIWPSDVEHHSLLSLENSAIKHESNSRGHRLCGDRAVTFLWKKCKRIQSFCKTSNQLFNRFHCSAAWKKILCTQQFLPKDWNINRMCIYVAEKVTAEWSLPTGPLGWTKNATQILPFQLPASKTTLPLWGS